VSNLHHDDTTARCGVTLGACTVGATVSDARGVRCTFMLGPRLHRKPVREGLAIALTRKSSHQCAVAAPCTV
jgi:hypothetical protein